MKHFSVKMLSMLMVLFLGFGAVSCSDDDGPKKETPKVSFEAASFNLGDAPVEVKVKSTVAPETNITIPLTFTGAAVKGTDYTVSSEFVTIKAGEKSGSVIVSRPNADNIGEDSKEFVINLGQGQGYELGMVNYANFNLLGEGSYAYSFDSANARINSDKKFKLNVNGISSLSTIQSPVTFTLVVDPEESTAVEGTHFTVDKTVTVEARKRNAEFEVKLLKYEEGKDVIVLRVKEMLGFALGSNPVLTIKLAGEDNFNGTWQFVKWANSNLPEYYGEEMSKAPSFSTADKITFAGTSNKEYTFTPDLTSYLKNYFGNESRKVTLSGVEEYFYEDPDNYLNNHYDTFSVLNVPGVNYRFSANASETVEAKVGFRIIEEDNQEFLEMVIDHFNPLEDELWGMTASWAVGMDRDDTHPADPTHNAALFPYRFHFKRVK